MRRIKLALVCLLVVVAIVVMLQNTGPVETRFLFVRITIPGALLLLVTLAIGFALGLIVSFPMAKRKESSND